MLAADARLSWSSWPTTPRSASLSGFAGGVAVAVPSGREPVSLSRSARSVSVRKRGSQVMPRRRVLSAGSALTRRTPGTENIRSIASLVAASDGACTTA